MFAHFVTVQGSPLHVHAIEDECFNVYSAYIEMKYQLGLISQR